MSPCHARTPAQAADSLKSKLRLRQPYEPPRRSAPYDAEPGYYEPGALWLYGNVRTLWGRLACAASALGPPHHLPDELDEVERQAREHVFRGRTLVCGVHSPAHRRAAAVPLRWGSPRVVVVSGGFFHHLGPSLDEEPFPEGRLWRAGFDPATDLAVSRRAPGKKPTFALHNPAVDRAVSLLAAGRWPGLNSPLDPLTPPLPQGDRP